MVSKVLACDEVDGKVVITPRIKKGKCFSEIVPEYDYFCIK